MITESVPIGLVVLAFCSGGSSRCAGLREVRSWLISAVLIVAGVLLAGARDLRTQAAPA